MIQIYCSSFESEYKERDISAQDIYKIKKNKNRSKKEEEKNPFIPVSLISVFRISPKSVVVPFAHLRLCVFHSFCHTVSCDSIIISYINLFESRTSSDPKLLCFWCGSCYLFDVILVNTRCTKHENLNTTRKITGQ